VNTLKPGWTTVIVRSENGEKLIKDAEKDGAIEIRSLTDEEIEKIREISLKKKRENLENIFKSADPVRLLNLVINPDEVKSRIV